MGFAELIYDALNGINDFNRTAAYSANTDITWFINALEEAGRDLGVARTSDDVLSVGDALMVSGIEPLLTPDRRGLADVAAGQLEANGVEVERVTQPHEHVLAIAGTTGNGWLETRILASRGWVFLVNGPTQQGTRTLVDLLDEQIEKVEGPPLSRN